MNKAMFVQNLKKSLFSFSPIVWLAVAIMWGIASAHVFSTFASIVGLIICAVFLLLSGIETLFKPHAKSYLLLTSSVLVLIGFAGGFMRYQMKIKTFTRPYLEQPTLLNQSAYIESVEKIKILEKKLGEKSYEASLIVRTIPQKDEPQLRLLLNFISPYIPLAYFPGTCINISYAALKYPHKDAIRTYLMKKNINGTIFLSYKPRIISCPSLGIKDGINRWQFRKKSSFLRSFKGLLSSDAYTLFGLILFGQSAEKTPQGDQLIELHATWGISHLLARSGIHLWIILFILSIALSFFSHPITRTVIQVTVLLLYTLLTWTSVSFARALFMWLVFGIAYMQKYKTHTINTLALAASLFLLYNPLYLFSLDFVLSFGFTAYLALMIKN